MNQLQKKLKLVSSVHVGGWKIVRSLVEIMDSVTVIESEWNDRFKQSHPDLYPLDLSKLETWSTFQECVSLKFYMLNAKFIKCDVVIYNGDNFDGNRTHIRFTATLKIPYTFLTEIKDSIKYSFESYCEKKYDEHLLEQKKAWVRKFAKDSLAKPEKPLTFR